MGTNGAVILAAGSGSRMGTTKQLLRIDGRSLVRRAADAAIEAAFQPIVLVTGADSQSVAAEVSGLPVRTALNSNWSAGIGSSIRCGISSLLEIDPTISGAAILLCDQPRLNADILWRLRDAHEKACKPMAACQYAGTVGPPCCFDRSMFEELSNISDADGAKRLLMADLAKVAIVPWPDGTFDLDTPEDWNRLIR